MLTDDQIAQIRERCEKATSGPWQVIEDPYEAPDNSDQDYGKIVGAVAQRRIATTWIHGQLHGPFVVVNNATTILKVAGMCPAHIVHIDEGDAEFIAHAREDIPALLDALSAARQEIAQLRAYQAKCIHPQPPFPASPETGA